MLTMTAITDLKIQLVEAIRQLHEISDAELKKKAYRTIVDLVNEIQRLDKNFKFNETVLDDYQAFRPNNVPDIMKSVNWAKQTTSTQLGAINSTEQNTFLKKKYNNYVGLAFEIAHERLPKLDTDGDKFGTIVNAITMGLIYIDNK